MFDSSQKTGGVGSCMTSCRVALRGANVCLTTAVQEMVEGCCGCWGGPSSVQGALERGRVLG